MKFEKLFVTTLLVFVLVVAVGGVVKAQAGAGDSPIPTPEPTVTPAPTPGPIDPGDIPELPALLQVLAGPQGWVILGVLVSMLLAKWAWYNAQASQLKQGIFLGMVATLSTLAYVMVTYIPATFWQATAPIWTIVAGITITWLGGNSWYALVVKNQRKWSFDLEPADAESHS